MPVVQNDIQDDANEDIPSKSSPALSQEELLAQLQEKRYKIMEMKLECACKTVFNIKLGSGAGSDTETTKFYEHLIECEEYLE